MKHSTDLLLKLVWSCDEFVCNSYGLGLSSGIGSDVCQRCSLEPGQMLHASIIRTPNPQSPQQYEMHFVHLVIINGDADIEVCRLGMAKAQPLQAGSISSALMSCWLYDQKS